MSNFFLKGQLVHPGSKLKINLSGGNIYLSWTNGRDIHWWTESKRKECGGDRPGCGAPLSPSRCPQEMGSLDPWDPSSGPPAATDIRTSQPVLYGQNRLQQTHIHHNLSYTVTTSYNRHIYITTCLIQSQPATTDTYTSQPVLYGHNQLQQTHVHHKLSYMVTPSYNRHIYITTCLIQSQPATTDTYTSQPVLYGHNQLQQTHVHHKLSYTVTPSYNRYTYITTCLIRSPSAATDIHTSQPVLYGHPQLQQTHVHHNLSYTVTPSYNRHMYITTCLIRSPRVSGPPVTTDTRTSQPVLNGHLIWAVASLLWGDI